MMGWIYLAFLVFSLVGMCVLDARLSLFWFADWRRAAVVHAVGFAVLLMWDFVGIGTGIFHRGTSPYMTGFNVAPNLPVEELFFLVFLCWLTMNLYVLGSRLAVRGARTSRRGARTARRGARTAGQR